MCRGRPATRAQQPTFWPTSDHREAGRLRRPRFVLSSLPLWSPKKGTTMTMLDPPITSVHPGLLSAVDGRTITTAASARAASKVYGKDDTRVVALDGVDIDFGAGQLTAIMGPSGSG